MFKFTAKFLQKAYGYDISGEVYSGSGPMAQQEQRNIRDTQEPQDQHLTPRNTRNMSLDAEAVEEFPEQLEGREPVQHFMPTRSR